MAGFSSRYMTISTSPRSPFRIQHYLKLLEPFEGRTWNNNSQQEYYTLMTQNQEGDFSIGTSKDPAFSARDKINRAPKAFGFVKLKPEIEITEAGKAFMNPFLAIETLTRQVLKYQFPSPYFPERSDNEGYFNIKPFLELIRLIYDLGEVSRNEFRLFGVTMTDYHNFDETVNAITEYRVELRNSGMSSNQFYSDKIFEYMQELYQDKIEANETFIRENRDRNVDKFIQTKIKNLQDYADAYLRFLIGTELVRLNNRNRLIITEEKTDDVRYILETIDREAAEYTEEDFANYMANPTNIPLLTDNLDAINEKINTLDNQIMQYENGEQLITDIDLPETGNELLDSKILFSIKEDILKSLTIKNYSIQLDTFNVDIINDINETFDGIRRKEYFDNPLYFEWNTWRALSMITDGEVLGNFKINTHGDPIGTAGGNMADIVANLDDINYICEVTLSGGKRQYETENEPVMRHLGELRRRTNKRSFGFFLAPAINESIIVEFYYKHRIPTSIYGGTTEFIPLSIDEFRTFFSRITNRSRKISEEEIISIHNKTIEFAENASDENDWLTSIKEYLFTL